jgi:hypothetical protein
MVGNTEPSAQPLPSQSTSEDEQSRLGAASSDRRHTLPEMTAQDRLRRKTHLQSDSHQGPRRTLTTEKPAQEGRRAPEESSARHYKRQCKVLGT